MVNKLQRKDKTKKKSKGFVYKGRSAAAVKERASQTGGRFDSIFKSGVDTFTPHGGENMLRIMPPTWEDTEHYGLSIWQHSRIGEDNSSYLCAKKMKGKACPICDAAREAKDDGEADEAKALSPTQRFLYYIVDRKEKEPSLSVYSASWTMDRDIAALCENPKTGKVLLIDHPDEGYDISFRRSGQGLKTRYSGLQVDRDKSPISDDEEEQAELLQEAEDAPLPSLLHFYPVEYLEKVLSGGSSKKDEELDEDEDEDEKPSKKKKRSTADDDDDEDEKPKKKKRAESDEDEEDEEEEAPSRARKKKRAEPEEDEDEDEEDAKPKKKKRADPDEDEEEEDEDEKPSKRRRRAEPDEDEEEDDTTDSDGDGDEDEEEDEKPKGRKRRAADDDEDEEDEKPKKKGKKADDDEDEEVDEEASEDEDEDEEDEKPKRRRRADPDEDEEEDEKPKKTKRVKLKR